MEPRALERRPAVAACGLFGSVFGLAVWGEGTNPPDPSKMKNKEGDVLVAARFPPDQICSPGAARSWRH